MRTLLKEAQNAQGKREAARSFFEKPWHLQKEKIMPPKKKSKTKLENGFFMSCTIGIAILAFFWKYWW